MNVYLIGYMAAGKSKLGKELADISGLSFVDLDTVFEEKYRIGIFDFFEKYGDTAFRGIEHQLLLETIDLENYIISTGGGTPCSEENICFIKAHGTSIYIRLNAADLASRLKCVKKKRPLLKNIPAEKLEQFIRDQLSEREPYYLQADHIVNGPVEDVNDFLEIMKGNIRKD